MKLAVLFTGGKDSCYAMYKAMQDNEIVCLITMISDNKESYMYHTPNISLTDLQAEAIGLPLVKKETPGVKEEELKELIEVIKEVKEKYEIDGIVTGAVASVYQASRIKKICDDLGLECVNPLWGRDQEELVREIVNSGFKIMISGVFAYPLDKEWLGKEIDIERVDKLVELQKGRYKISPTGEGGEYESTVLDAPFFKKKIEILESEAKFDKDSGIFLIKKAKLVEK